MTNLSKFLFSLCVLFMIGQPGSVHAAAQPVQRTIWAFYDAGAEGDPRFTRVHSYFEMPLNHLGYKVEYHDINAKLPKLDGDVHGALLWLTNNSEMKNPDAVLPFLEALLSAKRKLLVVGGLGLSDSFRNVPANLRRVNHLLNRIGVQDKDRWVGVTYESSITSRDVTLTNFERTYNGVLPPYMHTIAVNGGISHLALRSKTQTEEPSDLLITHANGGFAAENYLFYELYDQKQDALTLKQWYVNPFLFLSTVFDDSATPKPDVTTMNGRRIFYSHMDGDGWNNVHEAAQVVGEKRQLSSEVMYQEVFKPYTDFYFTVGVIAEELIPDCYGLSNSADVAREIYALPNVEPGSHSYSHPLYWGFFADYTDAKEQPYLSKYPRKSSRQTLLGDVMSGASGSEESAPHHQHEQDGNVFRGLRDPNSSMQDELDSYLTPRSYACSPFSLEREVGSSVDFINSLTNKPVKIYQWSGDTMPFEAAIAETREAGLSNINGGDSRLDNEYPSYASVAPISAVVGDERQIYSSNSNENTYTNLWTSRFYGYRYLQRTVFNTETPIRIDPFNMYFHTYSAEKVASLNALKENLNYARTQSLIPLYTSEYAAIAEGFFNAELTVIAPMQWQVANRGGLQTIRFDHAVNQQVDFTRSQGVIGQHHLQGSLYIALDPAVAQPVLALKARNPLQKSDTAEVPYIVESNWRIKDLQNSKESLSFTASGAGKAFISLALPAGTGITRIKDDTTDSETGAYTMQSPQLAVIRLPESAEPLRLTVQLGQQQR